MRIGDISRGRARRRERALAVALIALTVLASAGPASTTPARAAATGELTAVSADAEPSTAGATATLTVAFTTENPVSATGTVRLDLSDFTAFGGAIPANPQVTLSVNGAPVALSSVVYSDSDGLGHVSTLTLALSSAVAVGAVVVIRVAGVTNPNPVAQPGLYFSPAGLYPSVHVDTFDGGATATNSGQAWLNVYAAGLTGVSAWLSDNRAGATGATLTIEFTTAREVPVWNYVSVSVPGWPALVDPVVSGLTASNLYSSPDGLDLSFQPSAPLAAHTSYSV